MQWQPSVDYEYPFKMPPQLRSRDNSINGNESIEFQDEFEELPVRFVNTLELLKGNDGGWITEKEIQERDLRHAEELERHAQELSSLYKLLEETNQKHNAEIHMLRDESSKWEDLLEQALGYAEQLEASEMTNSYRQGKEIHRLQMELEKRDASIEKLRADNLEKTRKILELEQQISANSKRKISWWGKRPKWGRSKRIWTKKSK